MVPNRFCSMVYENLFHRDFSENSRWFKKIQKNEATPREHGLGLEPLTRYEQQVVRAGGF
jgi:hypothetical protein